MSPRQVNRAVGQIAALLLPLLTLAELNLPHLTPQGQLAAFALLGLLLAFLTPQRENGATGWLRALAPWRDALLALLTLGVFGYLIVESEPFFSSWWLGGRSLGERAGAAAPLDLLVGAVGLLLVLEATRRSIGLALPILALAFVAYGRFGHLLPDALLPHRGYPLGRIVEQTFLQSQGVFGIALKVMFSYVFLFVVFGAVLEATGATGFILEVSRRLFGRGAGGPAKVAVLSSGLMGSLSGSAVANTATTGTFTIPMMRSSGLAPHLAAGVEAAASSGGALVPPVMGAGAYMMLEIVNPPVTYVEILRAAVIPALLYYLSLLVIVHLQARRQRWGGAQPETAPLGPEEPRPLVTSRWLPWEGVVFAFALGTLVAFLLAGFSVFRAVSLALGAVLLSSAFHARTRLSLAKLRRALDGASRGGVPLVTAAACVGVVIGVVTLTGIGTRLPALVVPLAQDSLLLALVLIMACSILLGLGLPSAVCYLLMATLLGPALTQLGVVPLAAHLFIFYFGMMSMVTPPVALAAYAAASIAGSRILATGLAAFRFALVGFTLPYLFVFRPQLLMLEPGGGVASWGAIAGATVLAALGILPLAAAIAGYLRGPLAPGARALLGLSALLALFPAEGPILASAHLSVFNLVGLGLFAVLWIRSGRGEASPTTSSRSEAPREQ